MTLDADTCYRALVARDRRFDGAFFVGVATTGVYCRPVCTARTPRRDRCTFFPSAALAERAGYRPCLRCRPELAPGLAPLDAVPRLVAAAVARIDEGYLNERASALGPPSAAASGRSLKTLAAELGVSDRHLRRALLSQLGVAPVELAQSRRLALAKQLLHDSRLSLAEVAFAAGFASVRRFNALFRARFGAPPSALRRRQGRPRALEEPPGLVLRLDYRPPFAWEPLLAYLHGRALPGVERVSLEPPGVYRRTVRLGEAEGVIAVRHDPARATLLAEVPLSLAPAAMALLTRLGALFDTSAQPELVAAHLGRDPELGPRVRARPGLRVPGAFDPFELTVRAVLGQQVSVQAATTLAGRLIRRFGRPLAEPAPAFGLTHTFPAPATLAAAGEPGLAALGLPRSRARALAALAGAFDRGEVPLGRGTPPEELAAALEALPGIGPWTSSYVAMRALGWPDAFPAADHGVRRALGGLSAAGAARLAAAWRPWRAYAAMHLWVSLPENEPPKQRETQKVTQKKTQREKQQENQKAKQ